MALRVLSGLIFIPRGGSRSGTVTITFNPFALAASSNPLFELRKERQIGADGRFRARPATMVAARQFDIVTGAGGTDFRGRINDTSTRDAITISWSAPAGRVDQEEIPFMVIGEVPAVGATVTIPPGSDLTETDHGVPYDLNLPGGARSRRRGKPKPRPASPAKRRAVKKK